MAVVTRTGHRFEGLGARCSRCGCDGDDPDDGKPCPGQRCACGGIILADSDDWDEPVCDDCYEALITKCEALTPPEVRHIRHTRETSGLLSVWDAGHVDDAGRWVRPP